MWTTLETAGDLPRDTDPSGGWVGEVRMGTEIQPHSLVHPEPTRHCSSIEESPPFPDRDAQRDSSTKSF